MTLCKGLRAVGLFVAAGVLLAVCGPSAQAQYYWLGTSSGSWGTSGNWSPAGPPPSGNSIVFNNGSANLNTTLGATSYQVYQISPQASLGGDVSIGSSGGTLTLNGSGINWNVAGLAHNLNISAPVNVSGATEAWWAAPGTSVNISGPMQLNTILYFRGNGGATAATYNLSGNETVASGQYFFVGDYDAVNVNVTGGVFDESAGANVIIGQAQSRGAGTFTVSGGTYIQSTSSILYIGNSATGIVTVSGSGFLSAPTSSQTIVVGRGGGAGTLNLNGGTLSTSRTIRGSDTGSGTGNVYFNGGVLQAKDGNNANWLLTASTFNAIIAGSSVVNSGANINTNGYNMGVPVPLTHYASGPAIDGGLTKLGAGILTLGGSNTYTGTTTVASGTLALGAAGTLGVGSLTVAPGAVLDVSAYGASGYTFSGPALNAGRTGTAGTDIRGTLNVQNSTISPAGANTVGTLGISGSLGLSGATIAYDPGDQIAAGGALALSNTDYLAPSALISAGTYTLFTYNGGSPNTANLQMSGPFGITTGRQSYAFATSGGSAVTLTVTGQAGNLQWNGGVSGAWDVQTTQNWYNNNTSTADTFYNGDAVTLNDAPGSAANIALSGAVQPASLAVSNTAVNYTLSGTGSITGGAALLKTGPGSLTINNSNSYSGGTSLVGGTITAGAAGAIGTGVLTVNGGTLNANYAQSPSSVTLASGAINAAANGALGNGSLTLSGGTLNANVANALGTLPLAVSGGVLNDGAVNSLGTGALTVSGGTVNVVNAQGIASATVAAGLLNLSGGSGVGNGLLTLSGGSIDNTSSGPLTLATNNAQTWNGSFTFVGGNPLNLGTGAVAVSNSPTVTVSASTLTVGGALSGLALTKNGGGMLVLTGGNTVGAVTVSGGTLTIGNGSTNGTIGSGVYGIASGAMLRLNYASASAPTWANITGGGTLSLKTAGNGDTGWSTNVALPGGFTGTVQIESGRLWAEQGTAAADFGNAASIVVLSGGQLGVQTIASLPQNLYLAGTGYGDPSGYDGAIRVNGSLNLSGSVTLTAPVAISVDGGSTATYSGVISGASSANITIGGGSSETGTTVFSNANTYSGNTTVAHGSLTLANSAAVQNSTVSGAMTFSSSASSHAFLMGGLGGSSALALADNASNPVALTLGNNNSTNVYSGALSGSGSLTKIGSGAQTLAGANTYTGGTTISAGTLQAGNGGSTGSLSLSGGIVNNANLVYSLNSSTVLTLPTNTTYSGTGNLGATAGYLNFGGNLTVGGAFNYNATNAGSGSSGGSTTVAASSASLAGGIYYNGSNTSQLTIDTSAAGGAIALNSIQSGMQNIQCSFSNLDFNAGSGPITINGSNLFNWWNTGTVIEMDGQISGSGNIGIGGGLYGSNTNGFASLVFNNPGTTTYAGAISGYFNFVKSGSGAQTLSGASTYNGTTTINAGTLAVTGSGCLGTGTAISNSGSLVFNTSTNQSVGAISGSGSLTQLGPGTLTVTAAGGYSGGTTIAGGALLRLSYAAASAPAWSTITGGGTLALKTASNGDTGWGVGIQLPSTFTGTVEVDSGRLWLRNTSPVGNAPQIVVESGGQLGMDTITSLPQNLVIAGTGYAVGDANGGAVRVAVNGMNLSGSVTLSAPVAISVDTNATGTYSGAISGASTANLTIGGGGAETGTTVFSNANAYFGNTTVAYGSLTLANSAALQNSTLTSGGIVFSSAVNPHAFILGGLSGTSNLTLADNGSNAVALSVGNNSASTVYSGVLGGAGSLTKIGTGTLTLTGTGAYLGTTTISGGTLAIGNGGAAGSLGAAPVVNNATLAFNRSDSYGGAVANAIGGSGVLTVSGGSLTLSGNNSYTGPTAVSGGALYLTGANATSSIAVAGGATLGGAGSFTAAVGVANAGTLDFSQDSGTTFGVTALTFSNAATLNVGNIASYASSAVLSVSGSNGLTTSGGSGSVTIALSGAAPTGTGTAELLQYAGSIQGTGSAAFTLNTSGIAGLGGRSLLWLSNPSGLLQLNYSVDHPVWRGNLSGTWDTNTTQNWVLASNTSTATTFWVNDAPVFDDTAGTGQTTLNINAGDVSPSAVCFNNSALSYTLTGTSGITGAGAVTIQGGGAVTIATSNSYTGGTSLASGLLNLANAAALGTGPLAISGGTLDNTTGSAMTLAANNPQAWNGSFTFLGSSPLGLGTGAVTMNASPTVIVSASTLTVGGPIGGAGALTKNGSGTLLLAASNSYSGGTTISGGVLQLGTGQSGQDGSLNGTPAVSVASGASLVYNLYGNQTAVYPVSGGGSLVMAGPATLTLTGSNTYSGGTTISGGTLQVGNGGATGRLGSGAIVNNANLVYSLNSSTVLSLPTTATYSGSGNLTVTAGNLPFNGNLAVGGAFNYNATNGGSQVGQSTAASTVTATSASLSGAIFYNGVNSSSLRIDTSATGGPIALNSVLSGNPGYGWSFNNVDFDAGTGPINITGTNWFGWWASGASIEFDGQVSGTGSINVISANNGNATLTFNNPGASTYAGVISSSYWSIVKTGSGTQTFSGANTYSGGTVITAGTLQAGNTSALGSGGVAVNTGVLDLNGFNVVTGALSGTAGTVTSISTAATLNTNVAATSTFGGVLVDGGGPVGLIKSGTGTLILTGSNTATGLMTISAGTLQIGNGGSSGSIASNVFDSGTLAFNPGNSVTYAAVLSGSGTLRQTGAGTLILTGSNSFTGPTTINSGVLQLGGGGTSGSIDGTSGVADNGTLAFNRADNIAFAPSISGTGGVNKLASNMVTLTGASNYTGGTTVGAGALVVGGTLGNTAVTVNGGSLTVNGILGSGAVAINGGGTLGGTGTIGGPVTIVTVTGGGYPTSPGAINLVDGAIDALTLSSPGAALTLNAGAALDLEIGSTGTDHVALSSGGLVLDAAVGINLTQLAGTTISAGTYNLVTFPTGVVGSGYFYLNPIAGLPGSLVASLNETTSAEQLVIALGIPPVAYWQGASGAAWSSTSSWTTDQAGTHSVAALPASATDLYFATAGGTATVDQPFNVNSLNLSTSNSVTINGAATLTLAGSAGVGLTDTGAAAHTLAAPVALQTAQTWTVNGTGPLTVAGVISTGTGAAGATGLALAGTGNVIFTNANTYSGGTTVSSVTLQLGDGVNNNGSVTGNIADNGLLVFANPNPQAYPGTIGGTGAVVANGPGLLTFTAAHSYTGGTTIGVNGTLQLGDGSLANGSVIGNISDNGLLTFANPLSQSMTGTISGSGGMAKTAGGALTLTSAANSYAGGTTVSGGTLNYGTANALPTMGAVVISGGQLNLNGQGLSSVGAVSLVSGSIVGQSSDILSGSNFNVQSGMVGATLAGVSAGLTKTGAGTVVLAAANAYGGLTSIQQGTLQCTTDAIPGDVQISGGAGLDLQTTAAHVGTVSLIDGAVTGAAGATLVGSSYDLQNGTVSVNLGDLGGTPLVKSGPGTVLLSGNNSYTGGTSVTGGVLAISSSSNLGPGSLSLGAGTLQTTGQYALDASTVTLTDPTAGIDTPNYADGVIVSGLITGSGGLNKTGPGTLELANAAGNNYSGDTNVLAGTLVAATDNALSPASTLLIADGASVILGFGGGEGDDSVRAFAGGVPAFAAAVSATPALAAPALPPAGISTVPEPGTLALLVVAALGGLALWLGGRRK